MKRILILCLCCSLLLSGCGLVDLLPRDSLLGRLLSSSEWDILDEYSRPDLAEHDRLLEECCQIARTSTDIDDVTDAIYEYYDLYDWYYTCVWLSDIGYSRDITSQEWEEEYTYCSSLIPHLDAGLEALYFALADSPIRDVLESDDYFGEGYFDYYEGDSVYDDTLIALMEEESALIDRYYALSDQTMDDDYADNLCQVLIDLVLVRQEMAEYVGYDTYADFAWDFYYYRDYTPDHAMAYMSSIREEMSGLYTQIAHSDIWDIGYEACMTAQTYDYVKQAAKAMGGDIKESFDAMAKDTLYDISYSEKKFPSSYEVYLSYYNLPYVFVAPYLCQVDKLTFAHEFGHFAVDYTAWGSYAGIDIQEVFSQGMEYLSLVYVDDTEELTQFKMADCLSTYIEQSAYACFEQKLYTLSEEELTVDGVFALFEETLTSFGIVFGDWTDWSVVDLVTVPHFYTNPLYIISYVVSNDAAFQIYQMELEDAGSGLALYKEQMTTEEYYILSFVDQAGLTSPFAPGRAAEVAATLEEILGDLVG